MGVKRLLLLPLETTGPHTGFSVYAFHGVWSYTPQPLAHPVGPGRTSRPALRFYSGPTTF